MIYLARPLKAGHRDGSFSRIKRIELITRIAPRGNTARNIRAGSLCSQPLGMLQAPLRALLRNNNKTNPSNPENPLHPDETSVSVTGRNGDRK
jgi:hypothetical protein